ncbi:MAG: BatA domain-containing protein [Bacteroidota bacterium]|nr:BatA domain-containing protein [Bacteroidota bacterium]
MQFVNPGFLYALSAIAIPIIIHLFNFRRYKKEYFSNVKLLKELQLKTRRKSRLKHLILLFLRILAIIAIVLAFAQPYIPAPNSLIKSEESSSVVIYTDNSFSMASESEEGVLIEEAREKAGEIVASYRPSDKFELITNDFLGRHHKFVSSEDFSDLTDEVSLTPQFRMLSAVTERARADLSDSRTYNKILYLISDFQEVSADLASIEPDTNTRTFLVPLQPLSQANLYIDSCWLETPVILPGQEVELLVRVNNDSESKIEKLPLNLNLNERQRAVSSVDVPAGGNAVAKLQFTLHEAGMLQGYVALNDYPISFDDRYYISLQPQRELQVMEVYHKEPNPYLDALFENDSSFVLRSEAVGRLDYSQLNASDLLILMQLEEIPSGLRDVVIDFVSKGGSLLIVPAASGMLMDSYNVLLASFYLNKLTGKDSSRLEVDFLNLQDPFFEDVFLEVPENADLPVASAHYRQTALTRVNQISLMSLRNGDVFLSRAAFEKGEVYVSNIAFEESHGNFVRHALFVPVMYKIALSSGKETPLSFTIGKMNDIEIDLPLNGGDEVVKILQKNSEFEFIPEMKRRNFRTFINTRQQVKDAGNYSIVFREEIRGGLSFNYDRMESNLTAYQVEQLEALISDLNLKNFSVLKNDQVSLTKAVSDINKGTRFWKLFIILALAFLAAEIAIIRLWK